MAETNLGLNNDKEYEIGNVLGDTTKKMNIDNLTNIDNINKVMNTETDPDLIVDFDIVKLPSKGMFYANKISEVEVEYLTSKDEDILSTQALIETGRVFDVILKRKIKTKSIDVDKLLVGDKNAILLFLRMSSYGHEYHVEVIHPKTGIPFKSVVDLRKLKYKEVYEMPDSNGHFNVFVPKRGKNVKFKLLTASEEKNLISMAENMMEAYNKEYSEYGTLKLISQIVDINGNTDKSYIRKFVEAMPALDALTIRKKIAEVSPDVDMSYEFVGKDGFKFTSSLVVGVDFFFPNI